MKQIIRRALFITDQGSMIEVLGERKIVEKARIHPEWENVTGNEQFEKLCEVDRDLGLLHVIE